MRVSELVSDLTALRASLAAELEAINRLEPMIDTLSHDEARVVVKNLTDEHKRHAAMLEHAIAELDPRQAEANRAVRGRE